MTSGGYEDILTYNKDKIDKMDSPMPWILIVLEEVSGFRVQAGQRANELIETALSRWRKTGMVILAATQYSTKEEGFSPKSRQNFSGRICYRSDPAPAAYTLGGDSIWSRLAPNLAIAGDCIIGQDGKYDRYQTLFFDAKTRNNFLEMAIQAYASMRPARDRPANLPANPFDIVDLLLDDEPNPKKAEPQQALRLVSSGEEMSGEEKTARSAMKYLRNKGGIAAINQAAMIQYLWESNGGRNFRTHRALLQVLLLKEFGTDDLAEAVKKL
jgi:hypothetical protein